MRLVYTVFLTLGVYVDVSKNSGKTLKMDGLWWKTLLKGMIWGVKNPIFGNTHVFFFPIFVTSTHAVSHVLGDPPNSTNHPSLPQPILFPLWFPLTKPGPKGIPILLAQGAGCKVSLSSHSEPSNVWTWSSHTSTDGREKSLTSKRRRLGGTRWIHIFFWGGI